MRINAIVVPVIPANSLSFPRKRESILNQEDLHVRGGDKLLGKVENYLVLLDKIVLF